MRSPQERFLGRSAWIGGHRCIRVRRCCLFRNYKRIDERSRAVRPYRVVVLTCPMVTKNPCSSWAVKGGGDNAQNKATPDRICILSESRVWA